MEHQKQIYSARIKPRRVSQGKWGSLRKHRCASFWRILFGKNETELEESMPPPPRKLQLMNTQMGNGLGLFAPPTITACSVVGSSGSSSHVRSNIYCLHVTNHNQIGHWRLQPLLHRVNINILLYTFVSLHLIFGINRAACSQAARFNLPPIKRFLNGKPWPGSIFR